LKLAYENESAVVLELGAFGTWCAKNGVEDFGTSELKRRNPDIKRLETFGTWYIVHTFVCNIFKIKFVITLLKLVLLNKPALQPRGAMVILLTVTTKTARCAVYVKRSTVALSCNHCCSRNKTCTLCLLLSYMSLTAV
jgi:hypothetical protein